MAQEMINSPWVVYKVVYIVFRIRPSGTLLKTIQMHKLFKSLYFTEVHIRSSTVKFHNCRRQRHS